jgi:crossover junction endodeoxyribonuclease RuvC
MQKVILGLDPGTQAVGFATVALEGHQIRVLGHGVMVPDHPQNQVPERLFELGESFEEIMKTYRPAVVVIEKSFFHKNADTAFKLGQSRGVFMFVARKFQAEIAEYATRAVKKTVTGQGDADKLMVESALKSLLGVKSFATHDASDALALAYHHVVEIKKQQLISRAVDIGSKGRGL